MCWEDLLSDVEQIRICCLMIFYLLLMVLLLIFVQEGMLDHLCVLLCILAPVQGVMLASVFYSDFELFILLSTFNKSYIDWFFVFIV